jgi:threonylcarbamoyladenosine tRNA methylthiotransferase MtaB
MRRRYSVKQFLAACDRVAERVPEPAFTTDVLVGFPGEDEAAFENTLDLCRRVGFSRVHIFPYSPRRGTEAAGLPETVSPREKKDRLHRLRQVAAELTGRYAGGFVGRAVSVLVEEEGRGYTERYLKARVDGSVGGFVRCRARALERDTLVCDEAQPAP